MTIIMNSTGTKTNAANIDLENAVSICDLESQAESLSARAEQASALVEAFEYALGESGKRIDDTPEGVLLYSVLETLDNVRDGLDEMARDLMACPEPILWERKHRE